MRRILIPSLLCLALAASSTGCFGKFAATRKIYGFNESLHGNPFVRSAIMWALLIIPVYEVGSVVDVLILNPIELLTGSNPLAANECIGCEGKLALVEQVDGSVTFERGDAAYRLVASGVRTFRVERDGIRVGDAEITDDGGLMVTDADGALIGALSAAAVEARASEVAVLAAR